MIIPFFIPPAGCPHQCVFCDQKRITGKGAAPDPADVTGTIRSYLASQHRGRDAQQPEPAQVAFYGGSFTAIPADDQRAYLEAVQPFIDGGAVEGIRVSTRPDRISAGILALLRQYRVTTVELGIQSLDDEVLRLSGRGHSAEDSVNAAVLLRQQGFQMGLQLMPGLPGDSAECFRRTVRQVIALHPDFVRIYPAVVITGTPLEALYRSGRYVPLSLEDAVAWCRNAVTAFADAGIEVIRMGLQPTKELERPGTVAAGPFHPAFGQLVASSLYLEMMRKALAGKQEQVVWVHPHDLSTALGQRRYNLAVLRGEFGPAFAILPDPSVPRGESRTHDTCTVPAHGL